MKLNQLLKLGGIVLLLSTLLGCGRLWSGGKISLPGREDLFRMTIEQQLHQKYGDAFTVEQIEFEKANMAFHKGTCKAMVSSDRYEGTFTARVDNDMENLTDDYPRLYWNDTIEARVRKALDQVEDLQETEWKVVYVLSEQVWKEEDALDEYLAQGDTYLDLTVTLPADLEQAADTVHQLRDALQEEQLQYAIACSCRGGTVILTEKKGQQPLTDEQVYGKLERSLS